MRVFVVKLARLLETVFEVCGVSGLCTHFTEVGLLRLRTVISLFQGRELFPLCSFYSLSGLITPEGKCVTVDLTLRLCVQL